MESTPNPSLSTAESSNRWGVTACRSRCEAGIVMAGVFITRGMTVAIPAGGLKISLGPDTPAASVTLHVHFDVCPTWCELAMAHLETAKSRQADRTVAWQATEETENVVNEKARTLEREFESSMQAIMAAAIAIDAFYAVLQPHVGLEPELIEK